MLPALNRWPIAASNALLSIISRCRWGKSNHPVSTGEHQLDGTAALFLIMLLLNSDVLERKMIDADGYARCSRGTGEGEHFGTAAPFKADPSLRSSERKVGADRKQSRHLTSAETLRLGFPTAS
jgi:hypothetical protein